MGYIGPGPQWGNLSTQTLTPDSSTTAFTLDYSVAAASSVLVFYGGVTQKPEVDYTVVGTTITFTTAPVTGESLFLVFIGIRLDLPTPADASVTAAKLAADAVIATGTEQATTSGTSFTFSGIPAGTKRITIMFDLVSLSGTDGLLVQLGDAGGIETTGYSAAGSNISSTVATTDNTTGFPVRLASAARAFDGIMEFIRVSGNNWEAAHSGRVGTSVSAVGGGGKTLSGELTQIRLTRTGSDTFDNGSVNIMYEGK